MQGRVHVWDPAVRIGHWLLAASVAAAWLTKAGWEASYRRPENLIGAMVHGRKREHD